jgi:hypothetical protein
MKVLIFIPISVFWMAAASGFPRPVVETTRDRQGEFLFPPEHFSVERRSMVGERRPHDEKAIARRN